MFAEMNLNIVSLDSPGAQKYQNNQFNTPVRKYKSTDKTSFSPGNLSRDKSFDPHRDKCTSPQGDYKGQRSSTSSASIRDELRRQRSNASSASKSTMRSRTSSRSTTRSRSRSSVRSAANSFSSQVSDTTRSQSGNKSKNSSKVSECPTFDSASARKALESHFMDDCGDSFDDSEDCDMFDASGLSPCSIDVSPTYLNSMSSDELMKCGSHREPLYRRIVFSLIRRMNESAKCNRAQRDLILQSVSLICSDDSSECDAELIVEIDSVITFLYTAFKDLLRRKPTYPGFDFMKLIIRVVGALHERGEFYVSKIKKHRLLQKMVDEIIKRTSADAVTTKGSVVERVIDAISKSLIMVELLENLKEVMNCLTEVLPEDSSRRYFNSVIELMSKCDTAGVLLFKSRSLIKSLLQKERFTSIEKEVFQKEEIITHLLSKGTGSLNMYKHVVKIVVMLGDMRVIKKLIVEEHSEALGKTTLGFLKGEEETIECLLVKFWLIVRLCKTKDFRDIIFCTEGAIVEIMKVMRAVTLDVPDQDVLKPFYQKEFFQIAKPTIGDLISYFVDIYESRSSTIVERHCAGEVLISFASCLNTTNSRDSAVKEVISKGFIDSGIISALMYVLSQESKSKDEKDDASELMVSILVDSRICKVFVGKPLNDLHGILNSFSKYEQRSNAASSLITIVQAVARDASSHPMLFESDVVFDLVDFIKKTLTTSCTSVPQEMKISHILLCLRTLESIAAVEESQNIFKKMKLDEFLKLLLRHDNKAIRDVASQVLERVATVSDSSQWRHVFKEASRSSSNGNIDA